MSGQKPCFGASETIRITSTEIMEALEEPVSKIIESVHSVLERTPPSLPQISAIAALS